MSRHNSTQQQQGQEAVADEVRQLTAEFRVDAQFAFQDARFPTECFFLTAEALHLSLISMYQRNSHNGRILHDLDATVREHEAEVNALTQAEGSASARPAHASSEKLKKAKAELKRAQRQLMVCTVE